MSTRITPCPICQTPVTREIVMFMGRELYAGLPCLCPACDSKRIADEAVKAATAGFKASWVARIPDDYSRAKIEHVPARLRHVLNWKPGDQKGIGIYGPSGAGKSHTLALLLLALEIPFRWVTGAALKQLSNDALAGEGHHKEEARKGLSSLRDIPLLAIDDLVELRFSEAWAEKLFEILEYRNSTKRLTCWTAQHGPGQLAAKIAAGKGVDQGTADAIERRLVQHSAIFEG